MEGSDDFPRLFLPNTVFGIADRRMLWKELHSNIENSSYMSV